MNIRPARYILSLLLLFVFAASIGYADEIVVTGVGDGTLVALNGNGTCDLREAIEAANSDTPVGECDAGSGTDTVRFAAGLAGSAIDLTEVGDTTWLDSALRVSGFVTLDGGEAPGLILDAGSAQRHFYVDAAGDLTLRDLTVRNGFARGEDGFSIFGGSGGGGAGMGGAIFNEGGVTVERSTLSGNTAQGGDGGDTTIDFCGSGVGGGPNGGPGGSPSFTGDGTPAGAGGPGGFGGGGGGGGCAFNGAGGDGGDGGFGGGGGGGGGNNGGTGADGAASSGGFGGGGGGAGANTAGGLGGGAAGLGGAIFNHSGSVRIVNSTLSGNAAIGGSAGENFSAFASNAGGPGSGLGGAVFSRNANLMIDSSTLDGNTADDGGAVFNLGDDAISVAVLNNTLAANTVGGSDVEGAGIGTGSSDTSGVGNLIESASGFGGSVVSSGDPNLAALADNGGPTPTHAFAGPSPAIDAGDDAAAASLSTDQRGFEPRILGAAVDIGAFEEGAIDPANVTISDVSMSEGDAGTTSFVFEVTLDNDVIGGASVKVVTGDGTATEADGDYSRVEATLDFVGTAGEVQTVAIEVNGDTRVEGDETFTVELGATDPPAVGVVDAVGVGTIGNDDQALLSIDDVSSDEGDAGTSDLVFTVTLDSDVAGGVSVDVATAAGTASAPDDFVATQDTLTFVGTAGETQTIAVPVVGDRLVEVDETFTVTLSGVDAGGLDVVIGDGEGVGTIGNDDIPKVLIGTSQASVVEGGATDSYTVVLSEQPSNLVTVSFATGAQLEPIADLTFTPGSWDVPQSVIVEAADDSVAEGDHGASIGHSVSSVDADFDGADLSLFDIAVAIGDNDVALSFAAGPASPSGPISVQPGESDVVALQAFVISTGAAIDVSIETVRVEVDQVDLREIRTALHRVDALTLYHDVDGDGLVGEDDPLIGSATDLDEGTSEVDIVLAQPFQIAAGGSAMLLLTYDFAASSSGLPGGLMWALLLPVGWLLRRNRRRILPLALLLSLTLVACVAPPQPPVTSVTYRATVEQVTTDLAAERLDLAGLPLAAAEVTWTP